MQGLWRKHLVNQPVRWLRCDLQDKQQEKMLDMLCIAEHTYFPAAPESERSFSAIDMSAVRGAEPARARRSPSGPQTCCIC